MTPKSLGLLILFLWVQRAANDSVVTGIMGSTVELRCHYPEKDSFIFNTFRIQWQKKGVDACFVDAYFPNQDMKEHQCNEFVNRTQIEMQLKDGNFSLKLLHIGLNDALTYECMLQGNRDGIFRLIYHANITLKVAAYYSKPVLTGPVQSGEEMTFFCNSSHGYPQQKLYWINQTDNSILNAKENFTEEPDGTFSVYSTLTVKAASDIKLGCTIENEQLHQNITTTIDLSIPTSSPISDLHQDKTTTIVLSAVAAAVGIVVIFILYNWWNKKKPSLQRTYRDVCENEEAAHPNAPV